MAELSPADRIDVAIKRIQSAIARRDQSNSDLTRRHLALRARVEEAIASLDALEQADG